VLRLSRLLSGGLKLSTLIEKHLVDYYFPFLPLERQHVRQCIEYEFEANGFHYGAEDVK
jgi:hypothetical protein